MARAVEIVIQNGRFYFTCPGGPEKAMDPGGMCSVPAERGERKEGKWLIKTNPGEFQTLHPSIRCHRCGWHGYIKAGKMDSSNDSKIQL